MKARRTVYYGFVVVSWAIALAVCRQFDEITGNLSHNDVWEHLRSSMAVIGVGALLALAHGKVKAWLLGGDA